MRPTLAVLSVAQFLIALDYSIIYIALPSVAADLRLEPSLAQWVVSAYAVLFAGFLVVGGRLSDRVGAKRLFVGAIVFFGAGERGRRRGRERHGPARGPRRAGPRRRAAAAGDHRAHRHDVPRRAGPQPRARGVGRGRRVRASPRARCSAGC